MHRAFGELLKLGIEITEPTVAKYMVRHRKPPSQTWRTFLENHVKTLVSVDFFVVPTIRFEILYVFLVWAHDRQRILHFAVTAHPLPRSGPPSNFERRFPGTMHLVICCGIETGSSATSSSRR